MDEIYNGISIVKFFDSEKGHRLLITTVTDMHAVGAKAIMLFHYIFIRVLGEQLDCSSLLPIFFVQNEELIIFQ